MLRFLLPGFVVGLLLFGGSALAQESGSSVTDDLQEQASEIGEKIEEIGETLNEVPAVQDVSAGILQPIYDAAELVAFPSFYWVAFAIMTAGVVSFLFQLVLAKLFLLVRLKLNIKEIMSDFLGLLISAVGLILTTQAATENSTFPDSPVLVISAAVVGAITGFVFYLWGQSQEFDAAARPRKQKEE